MRFTEYLLTASSLTDEVTWAKNSVFCGNRLLATLVARPTTVVRQLLQSATFYHPDRLGSRLVTDDAGKVVNVRDLFAFGVAPGGTSQGDDTRLFTSYDRSTETGLDYAVNRF